MLTKHTESFGDFVDAVRELVWNASDAGAGNIVLRFEKDGRFTHLHVIDDGVGLTEEGLEAIPSLDFSPSASDPNKRGKKGNGSKGFVHHADRFRVQTRRAGESTLLTIEYMADELIEMWSTGKAYWTEQPLPAGHPIKTTGTVVSLLGLGTGPGVNPKHERTAQRLVAELGQKLPVVLTRKISVIDERGKTSKLKPRKVMGTRIEGEGQIENVGPIAYEIAVVPNPGDVEDHLELWGMEAVCDVRAFLARIRPTPALATLLRAVRNILDHPQVVGCIMIPGLNGFVSNTRRDFMQSLFDDNDIVFAVLSFFHKEIVPKVEKNLGKTAESMVQVDEETLRRDLVKTLQAVGGIPSRDEPIIDVAIDELKVSPTRLELEPGDRVTIEITNPDANNVYKWDVSKACGTLDVDLGPSVTFTAGKKIGTSTLSVTCLGKTVTIQIEIVAELPLRFATSVRHVAPFQKVELRLVNTRHTTGKFDWDGTKCGGTLIVATNELSASFVAGETEGEYSVVVTEKFSKGVARRTKAIIYIAKQVKDEDVKRIPSETEWWYGDYTYELQIRRFGDSPETAGNTSYLSRSVGKRPARIVLNFGHPSFEGQTEVVQKHHALALIASRIAQHELEMKGVLAQLPQTEVPNKVHHRAGEILADIIRHGTNSPRGRN